MVELPYSFCNNFTYSQLVSIILLTDCSSLLYPLFFLQIFIYDFLWLSQKLKEKTGFYGLDMVNNKKGKKIGKDLGHLITTNPREPSFYKESPKLANE